MPPATDTQPADLRAGWRSQAHPLLLALLVGVALRFAAAFSGYGWFSGDDYLYVIEPAWHWLDDPTLPFNSPIRSVLLPRAFWLLLRAARALGADDPAARLHLAYAALGLWSATAIPSVYLLARKLGARSALCAAWLVAAHALMPRISTRALIEVAAIPPLLFGLALVESARSSARHAAWLAAAGGALLGLAAMLRFQVGLLFFVALAFLALAAGERRARLGRVVAFLAGGAVAALAQGILDLAVSGHFLSTPLAYLAFNLDASSQFGVFAWYHYLGMLLGLTVPPITWFLARPLWRAARAHALVGAAFLVFVVAHSLIGHKEERFLFPILPVFFVLLGAALAELAERGGHARRAWQAFWLINALALAVVTMSDAQKNLTSPLLAVARAEHVSLPLLVGVGLPSLPAYYLAQRARVVTVDTLDGLAALRPDYLLCRAPPSDADRAKLAALGLSCDGGQAFSGDAIDRMLVFLNPRFNGRRAPTTLLRCGGAR